MSWLWFNSWSGDLDVYGFKKPRSHYRDVVWKRKALEMNVHAPIPNELTENITWWAYPNEQHS